MAANHENAATLDPTTSQRLNGLLRAKGLWSDGAELCEVLTQGLNNQSFRVRAGRRDYVIRLSDSAHDAKHGLDRAQEAGILRVAARAGLAPQVLFVDPEQGVLITRWLDSNPESLAEENWRREVDLIRQLHQLPALAQPLSLSSHLQRYLHQLTEAANVLGSQLLRYQADMQALAASLDGASSERCLCHNDLIPANLIQTASGVKAIDWEYAAVADPMFELAVYCQYREMNAALCEEILATYLQAPVSLAQTQHFSHMRTLYRYLDLLWYAVQLPLADELSAELASKLHTFETLAD